ncbi:malto-oligosyltrehalose synthase [Dyella sp.]|jgi:(1->4)-alpha-D-glucan 1-alpha-D-glucosylmutase|uniref:malto-oligosyltrehalose synthase n=1 Tax=Dyella sp. TaxID=1869338 RepID=UPI002D769D03|nr:malto-oligosyltrehalose synthase [Dyella sp.]HET6433108.1 malto-oligosyltrehalose synthase [Dyella sp.]
MREARATVRLQLSADFTFADATDQVPYYAALGITHYYLSPITEAVAGSTHGYDVIDPTRISAALGGEAGFDALIERLRAHGMGAIVDIVPNHLAADASNPWWRDVLARGRASEHAQAFDIDWDAPGCEGKLWLPILPDTLHATIVGSEIRLARAHDGMLQLQVSGQALPLCPHSEAALADASADALAAIAASPPALSALLAQQNYRLASWRSGNDVGNYRRFFDIGGLAALAMERPGVFRRVHALPLRLVAQGRVDGLRLDHVDGLARPGRYLQRLRRALEHAARERPAGLPAVSLHVEKILAADESLPADWPVDGTTGYDFMGQVASLWHDRAGVELLDAAWTRRHGRSFDAEQRHARRELLEHRLLGDFTRSVRAWDHRVALTPMHGDLSVPAQARAIAALAGAMTVYRTYLADGVRREADLAALASARDRALSCAAAHDRWAIEALAAQMLEASPDTRAGARRLRLACQRFEQLCAPLNAKAAEDTAFYRYGALLSRNEVGSSPGDRLSGPGAFHQQMRERARRWPRAMLATATHDHKRGEDTRARIAALSYRTHWLLGLARAWFPRWQIGFPELPERVLWVLLQTLLGAWPLTLSPDDEHGVAAFAARVQAWLQKAEREAGLQTRWIAPDAAFEDACQALLIQLLDGADNPWRRSIADAARQLDGAGALIGLGSVVLRLTAPGVPDLYQGTEYWDQSLVDPDNRRQPDYAERARTLARPASWPELVADFRDGRIKQRLIHALLQLRQRHRDVFAQGDYLPLELAGERADEALAFVRSDGEHAVLVLLARPGHACLATLTTPQPPPDYWRGTHVLLPPSLRGAAWRNALANPASDTETETETGSAATAAPAPDTDMLAVRVHLTDLPFAVLAAPVPGASS